MPMRADDVIWFEERGRADVALVGGKNASLGEMVCHLGERSVAVPPGFATAAQVFWHFIDSNQLRDVIAATLQDLQAGRIPLPEAGQTIRRSILRGGRVLWPFAAKDGEAGKLFIVQARPETVQSRREAGEYKSYRIKSRGRTLVTGLSTGEAIVTGRHCVRLRLPLPGLPQMHERMASRTERSIWPVPRRCERPALHWP